VDELIQQGLDDCQFVSPGCFTLSVLADQALRSRLQDPEELVLLLVAWASRCQAQRCTITSNSRQLTFEHDGKSPQLESLQNQLNSVGILSLAIAASLQLGVQTLTIEVCDGCWSPVASKRYDTGLGFRYTARLPFWRKQRFQRTQDLLRRRCLHSTLQLSLNGKLLNQALDLSQCLGSLARISSAAPLPAFVPAPHHEELAWDRAYSVLLATELGAFETQVHGVSTVREGYLGLAVGPNFAVDASGLNAVDDLALGREVDSLWRPFARQEFSGPIARQRLLLEACLGAEEQQAVPDLPAMRSLLLRRLLLARQQGDATLSWLQGLARLEFQLGHHGEAEKLWTEAYQQKREVVNAEGILLCAIAREQGPTDYLEPLSVALQSSHKCRHWEVISDWLWRNQSWQEAFLAYRAWLAQITQVSKKLLCLERLVQLAKQFGKSIDEENYRAQALEYSLGRESRGLD